MKSRKFLSAIARTATAVTAGAIGFGGMHAAGYVPGEEVTGGFDASTLRDMVAGGVGIASIFLPQLAGVANVLRSLNNHSQVEAVTEETSGQTTRLDDLEARVAKLERARRTTKKTTRKKK